MKFEALDALDEAEQKRLIESIMVEFNKKAVEVIQPIRVALSGKEASPGIFEVINILGKEVVMNRIKRALRLI